MNIVAGVINYHYLYGIVAHTLNHCMYINAVIIILEILIHSEIDRTKSYRETTLIPVISNSTEIFITHLIPNRQFIARCIDNRHTIYCLRQPMNVA